MVLTVLGPDVLSIVDKVGMMSSALLIQIKTAQAQGKDLKSVLSDILNRKCSDDGRVCTVAFMAWLTATLVFVSAVGIMILDENVKDISWLSSFSSMKDSHLQTIAASCAVISSVLFMIFLRLRQEQTKHTFLLVLVLDGSVKEAASLLFGGGQRGSKADLMADATDLIGNVM
jgi:hypothetical protein